MRRACGPLVVAALAWGTAARAQPVMGDVSAVGFRASVVSGSGLVIRLGQWAPIQVQLRVQGSQPFQGQLRCETADLDGDLVSYIEAPVAVTPDMIRRAWCYAVWSRDPYSGGAPPTLDVFSDKGLLITRLALPPVDVIRNDALLILDISDKPVTKLRTLETAGGYGGVPGYGAHPYYRDVLVASMKADELPDRWIGLEAVDVVVWDEPNPAAVPRPQMQALTQWVRNGGQLVVGLGQSWLRVQSSELAEIFPVQAPVGAATNAPTRDVDGLPEFFKRFVADNYESGQDPAERTFRSRITVAVAEARPGALRAVRTLVAGGPPIDLIADQWVGAGRVIALSASLRDLTSVPTNEAFFAHLFELNPITEKFRENERSSVQFALAGETRALYDHIVEPISFKSWSSVLVLAAFAFVVAYIGLATLASWLWLRNHKLTTLSWSVFAAFAVVASVFSLGTVGVLRGVSRGVKAFSLVDLEAGARAATTRTYFGYSSPSRTPVNLSLPGDGGFLRPLTPGPSGSGTYGTPRRYAALVGKALLQDAPRRATLKQFEALYRTEVTGSFRVELVADRRTGQIAPESWLQNDLDIDFAGGFLLYVDPRFRDDDYPTHAAGKTTNWWKRAGVPPGLNVLAVWIPPIPAGQKVSGIGQDQYLSIAQAQAQWQRGNPPKPEDMPDLLTLWDVQQAWIGLSLRTPLRSLDQRLRWGLDDPVAAALLASTRTYYLHCQEEFDKVTNRPISTAGLMNCDVSHWLMQGLVKTTAGQGGDVLAGQGVLLLHANDPGPARLNADGKPLGPVSGQSLYRVRVPLRFQGSPPQDLPGGIEP